MTTKKTVLAFAFLVIGFSNTNAQINLGEKALGALQKGIAGFTFSDAEAASLSKAAIEKMDKENAIAGSTDSYTIRLNKIFGKHSAENGLVLNYKVYKLKEVNAFATADGSVRVYSGLMDIMDNNELLAVIGHEIGHVANHDSRDAIKAAYKKEALLDAVASQSDKVAAVTETQLGKIGSTMIDSKHSRKQESEADSYSYDFMKHNGYNVNAVASAFGILAKMSENTQTTILDKMMSSHPDSKERAENARKRAENDGLYTIYIQQKKDFSITAPTKKPVIKKKKK
ncbi:M48 family metalloprotease [Flavobacterium sp.]|uniref:M48 family metalloprotease n=1 Tax=Flavobacterium sp. TaxID=239 RepID=UPI0038FC6333